MQHSGSFLSTWYYNKSRLMTFPFISNLPKVLQLTHSIKSLLKQENSTSQFVKACIEPLIRHQMQATDTNDDCYHNILSLLNHKKIDDKKADEIISSLFRILYRCNITDKTLSSLLQDAHQKCIQIQSNMNTEIHEYRIECVPLDLLSYSLSFLSPTQLRIIQTVSYSFFAALQKPTANILLNKDLLFDKIIMNSNKMYDVNQLNLDFNDVTFLKKYHGIKHLSVSSFTLKKLMEMFNYPNHSIFWNKFYQIQRLEIHGIENSMDDADNPIDNFLKILVNHKYIPQTLKYLKLEQGERTEMNVSEKTLAYFQKFVNLKTLYFDIYIRLIGDLRDIDYIFDNYLKLQSYINHIDNISIGCDHLDPSITPTFLSLFCHSNIDSIYFKLGLHLDGFDNFMNNLRDFNESKQKITWFKNLNNLKQFSLYIEPIVARDYDFGENIDSNIWCLLMINNMHNLHSFKISHWNQRIIFGNMKIKEIKLDNNMLYKVILNNINTLENIYFVHDDDWLTQHHGLNEISWFPLFLMYNVIKYGIHNDDIKNWVITKFKRFEFYLRIAVYLHYEGPQRYDDRFNSLKISLFPNVQRVIDEIMKEFKKYKIVFSIKLELGDGLISLYQKYFNKAIRCGDLLVFNNKHNDQDNDKQNQTFITDYFKTI